MFQIIIFYSYYNSLYIYIVKDERGGLKQVLIQNYIIEKKLYYYRIIENYHLCVLFLCYAFIRNK